MQSLFLSLSSSSFPYISYVSSDPVNLSSVKSLHKPIQFHKIQCRYTDFVWVILWNDNLKGHYPIASKLCMDTCFSARRILFSFRKSVRQTQRLMHVPFDSISMGVDGHWNLLDCIVLYTWQVYETHGRNKNCTVFFHLFASRLVFWNLRQENNEEYKFRYYKRDFPGVCLHLWLIIIVGTSAGSQIR